MWDEVPGSRPAHNPGEHEPPESSPRAILARGTVASALESQTMPGLPPDGAGSRPLLASATVALIKRTICLPLNQAQILFPSNDPEASRDAGRPSRLHLPPQGPGSTFPPPSIICPLQLWGLGVQEAGVGPRQLT